ncbi:trypsin-like peptidase domain-containing protein [Carboxylicivirga sediminis]|uniref:Trypsin-like peptidase domain-containing protein n=1 Tax=Carboxylicivirga sediminis TaxID=2006564 RepID=A0A941F8G3_9BACT|nr:trypsin-like peptidase domain-containing protein [Carboxylicivirga sediminis]MBR8537424.1 trypsin-like peptidase domain-containing protein [Carboxylicivirga sediminis]
MKHLVLILVGLTLLFGCQKSSQVVKEPWIDKPVASWPDFALTNQISFTDTSYSDIANSFLINTGYDTIGVSCKHLFMVFENQLGLSSIDLGTKFNNWTMYPKNHKEKTVTVKQLINKDPNEQIGQFNTLKTRDWIIFELEDNSNQLYPLKIRYSPVKSNETVYAVGWGLKQKDNSKPALIKLQCVKNLGDYFYIKPFKTDTHPAGRSGSPVIDKNGYLVGIVSGQEGNLGVIGGVKYLITMLDQYGIKHNKPGH